MARTNQMLRDDQSGLILPGSWVTSQTTGSPEGYKTVLTLNGSFPAIAGGANLGVGKLILTLPAGVRIITGSSISLSLKQTQGNVTNDTPDLGLGTVIASGVVATLDGTATFENIMTGQTMNDCDGTVENKTVTTNLAMETADAHTIYLNVADGWAASGDAALGFRGTATIWWR